MSKFNLPDEDNKVTTIVELTAWIVREEFLTTVQEFYNHELPYKRISEMTAFLAGQLYGSHTLWQAITGEVVNEDQINEICKIVTWMAETYEPGAKWLQTFNSKVDRLTNLMILLADEEEEAEDEEV